MKIAATKDFGNTKNNKIVLPLVPEPTETATKKEDLATVDLCSDPTDADSTKVRFAFKRLNGSAESPRDLIDWRKNVERAFTGLNSATWLLQHQMMQQFCQGTALSAYNSNVNQLHRNGKAADMTAGQKAVDDYVWFGKSPAGVEQRAVVVGTVALPSTPSTTKHPWDVRAWQLFS